MRITKLIFAIFLLVCVDSAISLLSYHNGAYDIGSLSGRYGHKPSSEHLSRKYIASHNGHHSPNAADDVVDSHFKVKKTSAKSYISLPLNSRKPIEDLEKTRIDSPPKYRKEEPIKNNYISLNENHKEKPNVKKDILKKASAPYKQSVALTTRSSRLNYSYARIDAAGNRLKNIVGDVDKTMNSYDINANRNRKRTALSPQQSSQTVYYSKTKTINQKDRQYAKVPLGEDSVDKLKERTYSKHMHKAINQVNHPSGAIKKPTVQSYMEEKVISAPTRMNKNTALMHSSRDSDDGEVVPKWRKLEPRVPRIEKSLKDGIEVHIKSDGYVQGKKTLNVVQPPRLSPVGEKNNQRYALFYRANPATINAAEEGFIPIKVDSARHSIVDANGSQSKSDSSLSGTGLDSTHNHIKQYRGNIITGKYQKFS